MSPERSVVFEECGDYFIRLPPAVISALQVFDGYEVELRVIGPDDLHVRVLRPKWGKRVVQYAYVLLNGRWAHPAKDGDHAEALAAVVAWDKPIEQVDFAKIETETDRGRYRVSGRAPLPVAGDVDLAAGVLELIPHPGAGRVGDFESPAPVMGLLRLVWHALRTGENSLLELAHRWWADLQRAFDSTEGRGHGA